MSPNDKILELHSGIVLKGQLSMVNDIVLTGKFEGDLHTLGRLTVSSGGSAQGTIEAASLVLEPGNQVEARVKIATPPKSKSGSSLTPKKEKTATASKWPVTFQKLKNLALGRKS